mmetsp:Transcript_24611/g.68515  ORF Transcript_24611/g.68515 Transcript_24611/m.68515 type:complete len:332 (-) Transcript_24611:667-1662(-)
MADSRILGLSWQTSSRRGREAVAMRLASGTWDPAEAPSVLSSVAATAALMRSPGTSPSPPLQGSSSSSTLLSLRERRAAASCCRTTTPPPAAMAIQVSAEASPSNARSLMALASSLEAIWVMSEALAHETQLPILPPLAASESARAWLRAASTRQQLTRKASRPLLVLPGHMQPPEAEALQSFEIAMVMQAERPSTSAMAEAGRPGAVPRATAPKQLLKAISLRSRACVSSGDSAALSVSASMSLSILPRSTAEKAGRVSQTSRSDRKHRSRRGWQAGGKAGSRLQPSSRSTRSWKHGWSTATGEHSAACSSRRKRDGRNHTGVVSSSSRC